jgi:hypothetical protein
MQPDRMAEFNKRTQTCGSELAEALPDPERIADFEIDGACQIFHNASCRNRPGSGPAVLR